MARDVGDEQTIALALTSFGQFSVEYGHLDRAEHLIGEARDRWQRLGDAAGEHWAVWLLGYLAAVRGEHPVAEALFTDCLNRARASKSDFGISATLEAIGTCAREQGHHLRAAGLFAESLTIIGATGDPILVANLLKSLGAVAAVIGDAIQATRLFGAAEMVRKRLGSVEPPIEVPRLERAIAPARARLAPAEFDAALAAGRALPVDQAITEALAVAAAVKATASSDPAAGQGLTPREREVLILLAAGYANREIAARLHLSERTVESHVQHVLTKLDLQSRTAAAGWAIRQGLA